MLLIVLKVGVKRRRTTFQIKLENQERLLKEETIAKKLAKFDQLKRELDAAKVEINNNIGAANILRDLH